MDTITLKKNMLLFERLLKKLSLNNMKKFFVFSFACVLLSACTLKPVLKNVPDDAVEKTINTPEQIEKIIKKND